MDTLGSLLSVKLDIREKRTEWLPLRSWTRCYVKIEAIRCFPCYIKITFHKTVNDDNGLVLRINIPGLEIYPVKSRTKSFAYGLYWKQNRKNCIAFLSLDSQLSMDAHMRWVDCQICNLETYRKEILQTSRCSRMEQSLVGAEDSGIYQNLNDTNKVRDVNEVLGPLPHIPNGCDSDKNWSRRVSGYSGIYEEIVDPSNRSKFGRGSAIYEEMKLNQPEPSMSPPPLPPRSRKNTDCSSLQRSYTTPESEMVKKKWNLFENVFGKYKRSETKRRERQAAPQPRDLQLLKAKRNSFSSPDLTHLDASSFNSSGCTNCSFDLDNPSNISSSNSYELENVCEDEAEHVIEPENTNISRNIKPNFELKLNSDVSSVNLVGCNYLINEEYSSPQSQPARSPPGYLEMRPGKGFDMKKVEELDNEMKNDVLYRLKYSFDSPITYKRESDYDSLPALEVLYSNEPQVIKSHFVPVKPQIIESHYVCMTKATPSLPPRQPKLFEESHYMPMNRCLPAVIVDTPRSLHYEHYESPKTVCVRPKRHSVDEKIPSYYPNYDVPVKCNGSPHIRSSSMSESVIKRSQLKMKSPEPAEKPVREVSSAIKVPSRKTKRIGSFNFKNLNDNNNHNDAKNPEISKKYATISRMTGKNTSDEHHQVSPSTIKKSESISPTSIKRFTSLPRFKKIDFSPLRLKISSVLQRHSNTGGC